MYRKWFSWKQKLENELNEMAFEGFTEYNCLFPYSVD